jgi:hypothetical protein
MAKKGPQPGTPAGNNKSKQNNKTSPTFYLGRGLPVPENLPSGPRPQPAAPPAKGN